MDVSKLAHMLSSRFVKETTATTPRSLHRIVEGRTSTRARLWNSACLRLLGWHGRGSAIQMRRALAHDVTLQPTAQVARHPIHPMLVSVPIVCFIGALLTDITYAVSAEIMWADFSAWFLVVGVIIGILAAIAGLIDFLGGRGIRTLGTAWLHLIGNLIVLVLAFFNALVHTRDAWTSV